MGDFVTLACPTCGGKLQITPDIDRFACAHCGNEHLVKRAEGVIAIQPLAETLTGLKRATDRTASELAIRRLTEELNQIQAAQAQTQGRIADHSKVIKAHNEKKQGCQAGIASILLTPLCIGAYLLSDQVISPGSDLSWVLMIWAGLMAIMAVWFPLQWLFSSDPQPARKVAEENLRVAEAELGSLNQALTRKQAEIAQHQEMVGLGS